MLAICLSCKRKHKEGDKELKTLNQTRLITHHRHYHPDHIVVMIEAEDYNEFGFKKYTGQKYISKVKK